MNDDVMAHVRQEDTGHGKPHPGEHEGCNYLAAAMEGAHGPVWFCNKCGWAAPRSEDTGHGKTRSEVPEVAWQAMPIHTPPETWTLTLNRYQRDNLLQLVQRLMEGDDTPLAAFNTGDWVGEVRWMLGKRTTPGVGPGVQQTHCIDSNDHPMSPRLRRLP